eukprot:SAG11_NODE_2387_length_3416_cov_9.140187_2_plen_196_part_00
MMGSDPVRAAFCVLRPAGLAAAGFAAGFGVFPLPAVVFSSRSSSVSSTSSSSELEGSVNSRRGGSTSSNLAPRASAASSIRLSDRDVAASSSRIPCCVCDDSWPSDVRWEKSGEETSEIHLSVAGSTVGFWLPSAVGLLRFELLGFRVCLRRAFFLRSWPDLWPFFRPLRCFLLRHLPWLDEELLLLLELESLDE